MTELNADAVTVRYGPVEAVRDVSLVARPGAFIAVTGPSTDNSVGVDIIRKQLGVPAFNAMSAGAALGDCVMDAVGLKGKDVAPEGAAA